MRTRRSRPDAHDPVEATASDPDQDGRIRILVFHHALGFVHRSIPAAVAAIESLGPANGFDVDSTEDPDHFTHQRLETYDALVFVHTSGNVLPKAFQRRALEQYMAGGGGFFGIHAAASMDDVAGSWPWYRELVGSSFKGHTDAHVYCDDHLDDTGFTYGGPLSAAPADAEPLGAGLVLTTWEPATIRVEVPDSPAGRGLTDGETRVDEWYGFHHNPRGVVEVVATVDESTYSPAEGEMGEDHPVIWWRQVDGGRSIYNSLGHAVATWSDESFLRSVVGGIELAAGSAGPHDG